MDRPVNPYHPAHIHERNLRAAMEEKRAQAHTPDSEATAREQEYRRAQDLADRRLAELTRINEEYRQKVEAAHKAYIEAEDALEELRRARYPEIYEQVDNGE